MIRRFGRETLSTYCQTLNGCERRNELNKNISPYFFWIHFFQCGPLLVSRIGDAGWTESNVLNVPDSTLIIRNHKKCCCIKTFGQWPWKLESVKECVTTHRTNAIALKINGAKSVDTYKRRQMKEWMWKSNWNYSFACKLVWCTFSSFKGEWYEGEREWSLLDRALVQILVVVASSQVRSLTADVRKAFDAIAFSIEWVDLKASPNRSKTRGNFVCTLEFAEKEKG